MFMSLIDSTIAISIVGAVSGLLGSIIGGLFAMWATTLAHRRQLEIQVQQLKGQSELKARELMFGLYQKKLEEHNRDIKQLGAVLGQLGAALNLPDIEEHEKIKAIIGFVGSVKGLLDPLSESIDEIEQDLIDAGMLTKWKSKLDLVKSYLSLDFSRISSVDIESNYQNLSKALTYITQIQYSLVEKKSDELFSDYLPKRRIVPEKRLADE